MKKYNEPEIALFRLSAVVMTASGDPDEWETDIIGSEDDYEEQSDDT